MNDYVETDHVHFMPINIYCSLFCCRMLHKRKIRCLECNTTLRPGRSMYNHMLRCPPYPTRASADTNENGANSEEDAKSNSSEVTDDDTNTSNSDLTNDPDADTDNYNSDSDRNPSLDDNYDRTTVGECTDVRNLPPDIGISVQEREVLKFLAIVEKGQGMSTNQANDCLAYVHTFQDARAQCLPKTVETCWNITHQVLVLKDVRSVQLMRINVLY